VTRELPVIARLCASEINASIETFFDCSWHVRVGDHLNGWLAGATVDSWEDAEIWLDAKARELFPDSDYAHLDRSVLLARSFSPSAEA